MMNLLAYRPIFQLRYSGLKEYKFGFFLMIAITQTYPELEWLVEKNKRSAYGKINIYTR